MPAGPAPRRTLGRTQRLKQGRDFLRLKQTGRRAVNGCLIANWLELPAGATARVGVVVSRKVGNAVRRSRVRRLLRETFRLHRAELAQPLELILVARPSIADKALADVEKDFLSTMRRVGLLKDGVESLNRSVVKPEETR
jgi:ribonuclease P protein component